jgi:hypothetical protein
MSLSRYKAWKNPRASPRTREDIGEIDTVLVSTKSNIFKTNNNNNNNNNNKIHSKYVIIFSLYYISMGYHFFCQIV